MQNEVNGIVVYFSSTMLCLDIFLKKILPVIFYIIISYFMLLWVFFVHICVSLCVFLVLFFKMLLCCLFYLPVYFLSGERKVVGVGWEERWGGSRRRRGGEIRIRI